MYTYGPAGTGKTETFKDFLVYAGKPFVVMSTNDQISIETFEGMTDQSIFDAGISVIFDEWSRANDTLYAFSNNRSKFSRDFKDAYMMMTFNGTALGNRTPKYATCIAEMTIPDYQNIAGAMIAFEGPRDFKVLAGQLLEVVKIMKATFKKCKWYDFGLRLIKNIVNNASSLFRSYPDADTTLLLAIATRIHLMERCEQDEKENASRLISQVFFGGDTVMHKKMVNFTSLHDKRLLKSDF